MTWALFLRDIVIFGCFLFTWRWIVVVEIEARRREIGILTEIIDSTKKRLDLN